LFLTFMVYRERVVARNVLPSCKTVPTVRSARLRTSSATGECPFLILGGVEGTIADYISVVSTILLVPKK
jgi:hypothetical protein